MFRKRFLLLALISCLLLASCGTKQDAKPPETSYPVQEVPSQSSLESSVDITLPEITENTVYQTLQVDLLGNLTTFYLEKDGRDFYLRYMFLGNDVYALGTVDGNEWNVSESNSDFASLTLEEILPYIDEAAWQPVTVETDRTGGAIAQNSVQFQVSIDGRTYDVLVYDYSDSYTFTLFGDEVIGDTLASGIINDNGTWTNSSFSSGTNTGEEWIGNDEVNARADEITALINKAYLTLGS